MIIFLALLLFGLSCQAATIMVTTAENEAQKIVAFHDQHRGTLNFIDMNDLDEKQREPLWDFFNALTQKKTPSLMLLELSKSERAKLARMNPQTYASKSFRKQLGYRFAQGKKKWGSLILQTWDERDVVHRQVSWLLANTIDTLVQIYQKKYNCTAETTCLPWFDQNAAQDFFNDTGKDSFHASLRQTVSKALLGKWLTKKERALGFWSVQSVSVKEYMSSLKEYGKILDALVADERIPLSVSAELKNNFDDTIDKIKQIVNARPQAYTMNEVILFHLLQSKSLQEFDQKVYQPISSMSVMLGDITLLKKLTSEVPRYDFIIIYAGNNHLRMVLKYLQAKGFSVQSHDVAALSSENPEAFKNILLKTLQE